MPTNVSLGQLVSYKGNIGVIRFIDPVYLTVCLNNKAKKMVGDVCLVVYSFEWDLLQPVEDTGSEYDELLRRGC